MTSGTKPVYNLSITQLNLLDGGEAITSWEFTPEELNADGGTTKPLGVLVENIANARPGSYTDDLTFKRKRYDG